MHFLYIRGVYLRFNETALFKKVCSEFIDNIQMSDSLDQKFKDQLMGEYMLLQSFTVYNDIVKMSKYHKKACELLKKPSSIIDTSGSFTFGSSSVLYMFHREAGMLEKEVR